MSTENLTTFTESGSGTPILTIGADSVAFNANTGIDAKLWKDYGSGHFGDFTHQFTMNFSAVGQAYVTWSVARGPYNRTELVANDECLFSEVLASGGGYTWTLRESIVSLQSDAGSVVLSFGTTYYVTVTRSGTALTADVRTGSYAGPVVESYSLTIDGTFTFSHLIMSATRAASSGTVTGTVGAPDINEASETADATTPTRRGRGRSRMRGLT